MYKVFIDSKAEQDLVDIFLYITEILKALDAARRLYSKIKKEISGLASMPHRCALIAEEPYTQLGVRKLLIENYIAFFLSFTAQKQAKTPSGSWNNTRIIAHIFLYVSMHLCLKKYNFSVFYM